MRVSDRVERVKNYENKNFPVERFVHQYYKKSSKYWHWISFNECESEFLIKRSKIIRFRGTFITQILRICCSLITKNTVDTWNCRKIVNLQCSFMESYNNWAKVNSITGLISVHKKQLQFTLLIKRKRFVLLSVNSKVGLHADFSQSCDRAGGHEEAEVLEWREEVLVRSRHRPRSDFVLPCSGVPSSVL